MVNKTRWIKAFLAGLILVVTFTGWLIFAPPQLGGQATMVIVNGNSMEPVFHSGDLVIVRSEDVYQVGDIIAYKNLHLGRYVIHRIIDEELNRFILKGDNNSWIDSFEPTANEIIGKHWLRIPIFGKIISWLRTPVYLSLSASLLGGFLMLTWMKEKTQKLKHKLRKPVIRNNWITAQRIGQSGEIIFFIFGFVIIASLIFGLVSFTRPVTKSIPQDVFYTHQGQFAYTAPAPPGVYDTTTIHSGLPVFLRLTCDIHVDYAYTLQAESLNGISGTQSMAAVISDTSGWKRTLPLQSETTFEGSSYKSNAKLDLCNVYQIVSNLREKTGLQRMEFNLSIIPTTNVSGTIQGLALSDQYAPQLDFRFNEVGFWLATTEQAGDGENNPLTPSSERMLRNFVEVPETISVLGLKIPVSSTRVISSILFLLSTGGFVYLAYTLSKISKTSREADIRLRYSPLMVDLQSRPDGLSKSVIDVASIQDLARLAERNNGMMLHEPSANGNHTYLVQGDGALYRFEVAESGPISQISTLVFKEEELRQAMEGDQFELVYQPMYDINMRQITGVEALLRWNHPILGTLPPSAFIADAEATGLINRLGEWVLQTACGQLREWENAGVQPVSLAINVSSKQLLPGLPRLVKNAIKEFKLNPAQLQLEFTEAQLIENIDRNIIVLDALKALGVEISIDNYTGQASVIHLTRLRAKNLKFALTLIEQMKNPEMAAITLGTIAAARTLGMVIEAVGVETEEQLDFLRTQLVTSAQGYLLGKPMPADDALHTLFGIGKQVAVVENLPDIKGNSYGK